MNRSPSRSMSFAASLIAAAGLAAASLSARPGAEPPTVKDSAVDSKNPSAKDQSPKAESPTKTDAETTLDELLGLTPTTRPPGDSTSPAPSPEDPNGTARRDRDLDHALEGTTKSDPFESAIDLMEFATDRLRTASDTGIQTQRAQADVLVKLDKLIEEAKQRQQKQNKNNKQERQEPDQQQQQQQQNQQQQQSQPTNQAGAPNIARQDAPGAEVRAGGEALWGNLPAHMRDALRQGLADRFSAAYRAKTEAYYKRLAEDATRAGRGETTNP